MVTPQVGYREGRDQFEELIGLGEAAPDRKGTEDGHLHPLGVPTGVAMSAVADERAVATGHDPDCTTSAPTTRQRRGDEEGGIALRARRPQTAAATASWPTAVPSAMTFR